MYSSPSKRVYSGWLKKHQPDEFSSDLKLQKFLFFYESLTEVEDNEGQFGTLKGYKNGPVFSDVYGDYCYERGDFIKSAERMYEAKPDVVNDDRAKLAGFLVKIMNGNDLSLLTHEFNIWKSKEHRINSGEKNVPLSKDDFDAEDRSLMTTLKEMYPIEYIDSVEVIKINSKYFLMSKEDYQNINEQQRETLDLLSYKDELLNPVYISINEDGVILVD